MRTSDTPFWSEESPTRGHRDAKYVEPGGKLQGASETKRRCAPRAGVELFEVPGLVNLRACCVHYGCYEPGLDVVHVAGNRSPR
jgi:hypothetical protein